MRLAFRLMLKYWGLSLVATLSLAVAIGGNTLVFSLLNSLLWRPLPFEEPDRLCLVSEVKQGENPSLSRAASSSAFFGWREYQSMFSDLAAVRQELLELRWHDRDDKVAARGMAVSSGFFELLGVRPAAGRGFSQDLPADGRVTVLTHRFWRRSFPSHEDPSQSLGHTLNIDGVDSYIVGVLAPDFSFLDPKLQLFVPLDLDLGQATNPVRELLVVGRLEAGVDEQHAEAEMASIIQRLAASGSPWLREHSASLINLRHEVPDSTTRRMVTLIQVAVLFVLLIAVANLANLLLALHQTRQREFALRAALGSSPFLLIRQLLTESGVLALLGAAASFAVVLLGMRPLRVFVESQAGAAYAPAIDWRVLSFMMVVTGGVALIFGLAPVLATRRLDLVSAIQATSPASSGGRRRGARVLVIVQIALTMMMLCGAGLVIQTLSGARGLDPGFETSGLLTIGGLSNAQDVSKKTINPETLRFVSERLAALPGVQAAAISNTLPRSPFTPRDTVAMEASPQSGRRQADVLSVSMGYFDTIGIPLLSGRDFNRLDRPNTPPVVIVNQALANSLWPGENPIGRRLFVRGQPYRVVGMAANVLHSFVLPDEGSGRPVAYLPFFQAPSARFTFVLRTHDSQTISGTGVLDALARHAPDLLTGRMITLNESLDRIFAGRATAVHLLVSFGILAILLATLGIWGLLAHNVSQRTREMAIRTALGAEPYRVLSLILREGGVLAMLGILLGLPGSWALARILSGSIRGAVFVDFWVVLGIAVVILACAILAAAAPAVWASRLDPIAGLRYERHAGRPS